METKKLQTAKILAFPNAQQREKMKKQMRVSANEMVSTTVHPSVDFGSCWYHDNAIAQVPSAEKN